MSKHAVAGIDDAREKYKKRLDEKYAVSYVQAFQGVEPAATKSGDGRFDASD